MGAKPDASNGLGGLVQGQAYSSHQRDNSPNPSNSNKNAGLVQGGAKQGLEAFISDHSNEHQIRRPSNGSSDVGSNPQPVVEIPHGYSTGVIGGS